VDPEELADGALAWLLNTAIPVDGGLVWPDATDDPQLYHGAAGVVLALLEAYHHFGDERYADAAVRAAATVAAAVDDWDYDGFYVGLTGMAFALHAVASVEGAARALDRVRSRFDGQRWSEQFELLFGNAGIALGALAVGDLDLAELAVTPYLTTAEPTAGGVTWETRAGRASRLHHISHGTLGVVYALTAVGRALGRVDMTELALAGAADVISRNEGGPDDFLVPHSDPPWRPELIERYSYGWCHGPAGDAQVFRLLGFDSHEDRCWHTVVHSGLPQRPRPGFWDNNARCCGTAGVLALACDRMVERGSGAEFAAVLVEDLTTRATADADGIRWSNVEHRVEPSTLEPRSGWAMGSAGIIRELLRYVRVTGGRDQAYAIAWPDHPPAVRRDHDQAAGAAL
jgi:lantibiotic modifying enzyme